MCEEDLRRFDFTFFLLGDCSRTDVFLLNGDILLRDFLRAAESYNSLEVSEAILGSESVKMPNASSSALVFREINTSNFFLINLKILRYLAFLVLLWQLLILLIEIPELKL